MVEMTDLKRFFRLGVDEHSSSIGSGDGRPLHVLYLGRRHPLKGVEFLEKAVAEVNTTIEKSEQSNNRTICLRVVSDHFGEELEKDWEWCDVLALPTLSENFGRVVAEALEPWRRQGCRKHRGVFVCHSGREMSAGGLSFSDKDVIYSRL